MILYDASRWIVGVAHVVVNVLLWHLNECYVGDTVSYLEATELEGRPIVSQLAQKPIRR